MASLVGKIFTLTDQFGRLDYVGGEVLGVTKLNRSNVRVLKIHTPTRGIVQYRMDRLEDRAKEFGLEVAFFDAKPMKAARVLRLPGSVADKFYQHRLLSANVDFQVYLFGLSDIESTMRQCATVVCKDCTSKIQMHQGAEHKEIDFPYFIHSLGRVVDASERLIRTDNNSPDERNWVVYSQAKLFRAMEQTNCWLTYLDPAVRLEPLPWEANRNLPALINAAKVGIPKLEAA